MDKEAAGVNAVTMAEEYSKELLIAEASMIMQGIINQWPDLVVDDICQTMVRVASYKDGKADMGEVRWHLTVGSVNMGVARQVEVTIPIRGGYLIQPVMGRTPQGVEVPLESTAFSNFIRLGIL